MLFGAMIFLPRHKRRYFFRPPLGQILGRHFIEIKKKLNFVNLYIVRQFLLRVLRDLNRSKENSRRTIFLGEKLLYILFRLSVIL